MRIIVEGAFGMLVNKWGILWSPLNCSLAKAILVTRVCCKLHNFCIDERLASDDDSDIPSLVVERVEGTITVVGGQQVTAIKARVLVTKPSVTNDLLPDPLDDEERDTTPESPSARDPRQGIFERVQELALVRPGRMGLQ